MSNANLITEARLNAPHSEDESLIMRLVVALERAEKMSEAAMEDLADGEAVAAPIRLEVLPDPNGSDQVPIAIVSDYDILTLAGHLRSEREVHAGRWAYPFSRRQSALGAAQRLVDENPGVYVLYTPTPDSTR